MTKNSTSVSKNKNMSITFQISNQDVPTKQTNQKSFQTEGQRCCDPQCSSYNFLYLELNTRLPTKKTRKLDVDAFGREGKRFKSQIHLIIISRDCWGPIGSNMTCVHLLPQAKFEFKDSSIQHKNCLIYSLYAPYLPMQCNVNLHIFNICQ